MKNLIIILIALLFTAPVFAQKGKVLEANDPLVGEWTREGEEEYDETAGMLMEYKILSITAGDKVSMMAIFYSEEMGGYAAPVYFVAHSDGKNLSGKIEEGSALITEVGKVFSYAYKYDKAADTVTFTDNGKTYVYKRSKKK